MAYIQELTKRVNEFRLAYPNFKKSEYSEYFKETKYREFLIAAFVKESILIRVGYGAYQWIDEPIHISRIERAMQIAKDMTKKVKPEVKEQINLQFTPIIENLKRAGLKVNGNEERMISIEQQIEILKIAGFDIFKPVVSYEQI